METARIEVILSNRTAPEKKKIGHCVICNAKGTSEQDFICSDCGDPLCATMYCANCHRRLNLDSMSAKAFLEDYGYVLDDVEGVIIRVSRCGECIQDSETAELEIFRIHFDS